MTSWLEQYDLESERYIYEQSYGSKRVDCCSVAMPLNLRWSIQSVQFHKETLPNPESDCSQMYYWIGLNNFPCSYRLLGKDTPRNQIKYILQNTCSLIYPNTPFLWICPDREGTHPHSGTKWHWSHCRPHRGLLLKKWRNPDCEDADCEGSLWATKPIPSTMLVLIKIKPSVNSYWGNVGSS